MTVSHYIDPFALSIARAAAEREGFTLAFLQGRVRNKAVSLARQAVAWTLAKDTDASLCAIAAILKKDHTSILYAVRAENERRGARVRGMTFPDGYRERNRLAALLYATMSREVVA